VAHANLDKARKDSAKWKNGPLPADLAAARAKVAAAEATISQDRLEAPFDGGITQVQPKVGDTVFPETAAFRIDDLSALFVDVDVSEIDINQVRVGQDAELLFDAIPDQVYHGRVTQVALTGESSSEVVNYMVTVQVDDADEAVRPGMTAQVDITTATRQGVLLVPNQAIQLEDGQTVVYVLQPGGQRLSVPVTLGLADETSTEIVSGEVKAGDKVVLNPATQSDEEQEMRMRMGPFGGGPPPGERRSGGGNGQP